MEPQRNKGSSRHFGGNREIPSPMVRKDKERVAGFLHAIPGIFNNNFILFKVPLQRRHPGTLSCREEEILLSSTKIVDFANDFSIDYRSNIIRQMIQVFHKI